MRKAALAVAVLAALYAWRGYSLRTAPGSAGGRASFFRSAPPIDDSQPFAPGPTDSPAADAALTPAAPSEHPMAPPRKAGPCATDQECSAYCADARNVAECKPFARGDKAQMTAALRSASPEVRACVEGKKGAEADACFAVEPEEIPPGLRGPGGCSSARECAAYCSDPAHREECYPPLQY